MTSWKPNTEEARKASGERLRARWKDPAYRARMAALSSERMTHQNHDPVFQSKAQRARPPISDERKAAASRTMRRHFANPENRKRAAECTRTRMADPAKRAAAIAYATEGSHAYHKPFHCPPEYRGLYQQLRDQLGTVKARLEISRIIGWSKV